MSHPSENRLADAPLRPFEETMERMPQPIRLGVIGPGGRLPARPPGSPPNWRTPSPRAASSIIDAILRGDPPGARAAMAEHLEGTASLLRGFLC